MTRIFRNLPGELCPYCNSLVEILTDSTLPPGSGFWGDTVTCTKCVAVGELKHSLEKGINVVEWKANKEKKKEEISISFLALAGTMFALLVFWLIAEFLLIPNL